MAPLGALAGMLALILDSRTALQGASQGISLCIGVVIPSLFPFFFFSSWLTQALAGKQLRILTPLGRFLGIPQGAEGILVPSILGGYPAGAQAVAQYARQGCIGRRTAGRLLAFCSNAGPSFLFGMTARQFSSPWAPWLLWTVHLISAGITARIWPACPPDGAAASAAHRESCKPMEGALRSMALVCGWVILFRVLLAFGDRWLLWMLPEAFRPVIQGMLELTNGICGLGWISREPLRFLACSGLLALGGLCVTMQTFSVIGGLPRGPYLKGKLLQCIFSLLLSAGLLFPGLRICLLVPLLPLFFGKIRKRDSIPGGIRV